MGAVARTVSEVPLHDERLAALQRRTMAVLRVSQVPAQASVAGIVAVGTLLASDLLGSDRLAGLGGAALTVGSASASIPLAAVMRRSGRRPGLAAAFAVAAVGSVVGATGGQVRWFPVFVLGMVLVGAGQAGALQARYVATDLAAPGQAARAIAGIVWVGTIGAGIGPILTPWQRRAAEALGLEELIGPYLAAGVLFVVASSAVLVLLRPDPLVVAGGVRRVAERVRPWRQARGAFAVIAAAPGARLGLVAMAASQAAMVGVMTMTPPHMKDHGHSELSAFVIALHVVGMYGLAPLVGRVVERIGPVRSVQAGAAVLGAGTVTSVLGGYVPTFVFVGLFLLGVGWSIGLIAGTTLLTHSVPDERRVEVQGTGDLAMSLCGAVAAFGSGFVKAAFGYHLLADAATLVAGLLFVAAWTAHRRTVAPAAT